MIDAGTAKARGARSRGSYRDARERRPRRSGRRRSAPFRSRRSRRPPPAHRGRRLTMDRRYNRGPSRAVPGPPDPPAAGGPAPARLGSASKRSPLASHQLHGAGVGRRPRRRRPRPARSRFAPSNCVHAGRQNLLEIVAVNPSRGERAVMGRRSRARSQSRKCAGSSGKALIKPAGTLSKCWSQRVPYATPRAGRSDLSKRQTRGTASPRRAAPDARRPSCR